jgi:hypothetical protein
MTYLDIPRVPCDWTRETNAPPANSVVRLYLDQPDMPPVKALSPFWRRVADAIVNAGRAL